MILITSGCSFSTINNSEYGKTWPAWLAEYFTIHSSEGQPGQSNDLIARRLMYRVTKALKNYGNDDLFVGIMWSSPDRASFFNEEYKRENLINGDFTGESITQNFWAIDFKNTDQRNMGEWIKILPANVNVEPKSKLSEIYYKNYYSSIHAQIVTMEYILLTQLFLKKHNIKYFMCCLSNNVLESKDYNWKEHISTSWYYDLIDWSNFISEGQRDWIIKTIETPFLENDHPTSEQHEAYTNQIILPFITPLLPKKVW